MRIELLNKIMAEISLTFGEKIMSENLNQEEIAIALSSMAASVFSFCPQPRESLKKYIELLMALEETNAIEQYQKIAEELD